MHSSRNSQKVTFHPMKYVDTYEGEGRFYKNYQSEGKETYIDILTVVSCAPPKRFSKTCCLGGRIIYHCLGGYDNNLGEDSG